jgi:hypothetical protein
MSSNTIDSRLLEDIRAGSCVAFVGAGFSAAAGLPSWPSLLRTLAAAIPVGAANDAQRTLERLLDAQTGVSNRELEMAAQLLFDALGAERCRALLREALKKEPLPDVMQLRLKHLFGIPFRAIVTTNFDPLIAGVPPDPAAYRRLLRAPRYSPWREAITRAALGLRSAAPTADAPDRPVIQLHGTLNDDETIVFTRAQYRRRLYANPAYLTVLRALLATSSVLFLGYSLRDAYLNELRAELVEALQGGEGRSGDGDAARPLAWAVLEDISDVARAYYEKHEGLGVLAYRTANEGRDHSGFDRLLAQIYAETNPIHRLGQLLKGRRLMWFDPSPANNELGRRLLTEAVRDVEGTNTGPGSDLLVDVADLAEAVRRLHEMPPFDLIISHWGHGLGPDGTSNGETLLRAAAARHAQGGETAPIVIFGGPEFAAENRRRALSLGAFAFTSEWQALMGAIERVLGDARPAA